MKFWQDIGASEFIIDVINLGYKLPFYSKPSNSFSKNNRSSLCEPEFVNVAIQDLLDRSLIVKCSVAIGVMLAALIYFYKNNLPKNLAYNLDPLYSISLNKWYVDELYNSIFITVL